MSYNRLEYQTHYTMLFSIVISVTMLMSVRFSGDVSVYFVPNFCNSRCNDNRTRNNCERITHAVETELSQTFGGGEGVTRSIPNESCGSDTESKGEQTVQVRDDCDNSVYQVYAIPLKTKTALKWREF